MNLPPLSLLLMRSTKLSATTKLSAEHKTPHIATVLLWAGFLVVSYTIALGSAPYSLSPFTPSVQARIKL